MPQRGSRARPPASHHRPSPCRPRCNTRSTTTRPSEQVNAQTADVRVSRAAYLPRLDGVWQTNRATVNNVTGLLLPQFIVPGISGPPLPIVSAQSAWGTAVGALLSWEVVDFGLRDALVRDAEAEASRARAEETLTRLDVLRAVAAAFLAVVEAERALTAMQADVERRLVLARVARALADTQLRPGAEASRADAERAAAETRTIVARRTLALARTTLARLLGVADGTVGVDGASVLMAVPAGGLQTGDASRHPLAQARRAALDVARAREQVVAHENRPRLYAQASLSARGTGARVDGSLQNGLDGLGLERANWAAGVQIVFPNLFESGAVRARREATAARTNAEGAHYEEALLAVGAEQQSATALLEAALAVAAHMPVQLEAARLTETQARARYQAGRAGIIEVAEAQNLLAQAEYQDVVARIDVWRAFLAQAAANGDLAPLVHSTPPGPSAPGADGGR
jgi:outer membrane protein TolC